MSKQLRRHPAECRANLSLDTVGRAWEYERRARRGRWNKSKLENGESNPSRESKREFSSLFPMLKISFPSSSCCKLSRSARRPREAFPEAKKRIDGTATRSRRTAADIDPLQSMRCFFIAMTRPPSQRSCTKSYRVSLSVAMLAVPSIGLRLRRSLQRVRSALVCLSPLGPCVYEAPGHATRP